MASSSVVRVSSNIKGSDTKRSASDEIIAQYETVFNDNLPDCLDARYHVKYSRNPFMNYYLELFVNGRSEGKRVTEVAKYAGCKWAKMDEMMKRPYYKMAELAPKRRVRGRLGMKRKARHGERRGVSVVSSRGSKSSSRGSRKSARGFKGRSTSRMSTSKRSLKSNSKTKRKKSSRSKGSTSSEPIMKRHKSLNHGVPCVGVVTDHISHVRS
ncbi:hypothetical protein WDU94_004080 [Cyamophila willieti]